MLYYFVGYDHFNLMNKIFYNRYDDLFKTISSHTQSIYRGQSNTGKFWEILSSYNRKYKPDFHKNHADKLKCYLGKYKKIKEYSELMKLDFIDLLIYLQHYGFPTLLVDFTKDPYIAFYFACSDVHYSVRSRLEFFNHSTHNNINKKAFEIAKKCSNGNFLETDELDFLFNYQKDFFVSLIEIDLKKIVSNGFLSDIGTNHKQYDYDFLDKIKKDVYIDEKRKEVFLFSILNPYNCKININLCQQKGVLLYFDSSVSLDEFLKRSGYDYILTYHLIPKPFLNLPDHAISGKETIFQYLKNKRITGEYLFNDLQGFRYDFLNYLSGE